MICALDTECSGRDMHHGSRPFFVTIAFADGMIKYWEWDVNPETREPNVLAEDVKEIWATIDEADEIVLQNAKFDALALSTVSPAHHKFPWEKVHDTLLAAHLLYSNRPKDLTTLAATYIGRNIKDVEDELENAVIESRKYARASRPTWRITKHGLPDMPSVKKSATANSDKKWKADMWLPRCVADALDYSADHPYRTVLAKYSNEDSAVTLAVWVAMRQEVMKRGLWELYLERRKLLPILDSMETHGVTYSKSRLDTIQKKFTEESDEHRSICVNIAEDMGFALDLKSGVSNSLRMFVYDVMGLEKVMPPKGGQTANATLDSKTAIPYYLATLPQNTPQRTFIETLASKRACDSALGYIEQYQKYGLPSPKRNASPDTMVLYPWINPTATDTLRFSFSNPNCVDAETEFLTTKGWVKADELTTEHNVAQYWKNTGRIDFCEPEIVNEHFTGNMYHIKTDRYIDMLVTPNHRCLLQHRQTLKKSDYPASDFKEDYKHFHAGIYEDGEQSLTADQVTWLCAVQADGSYQKTNGSEYGITLIFKKQRKIDRLRECLNEMGAEYSESIWENGAVVFRVGKHNPLTKFAKLYMPDKCFGDWLLDFDRKTLDLFAEEVFFWDGVAATSRYSSSTKKNSDWVQIVHTLSGNRSWIKSEMPASSWAKKEHHYLSITKNRDYSLTTNCTKEVVAWNDRVYCVTVPSSYVIIRRNGKVSVTGNSSNISKREGYNTRVAFGPADGREWWAFDAENIELRIPAYEAEEKELIDLFERPNDPPYYGSEHLLNFSTVYPDIWQAGINEVGFDNVGPWVKEFYKSTWYAYCKAGDFAVQYGAVDRADGKGTADRTFRRPGSHARLKSRFARKEKLNQKWIDFANRNGYVETMPDKTVNPKRGYPLLCSRTDWGGISPTVPLSYHIQGTAMWWTSKGMVRVHNFLESLNDGMPFCGKLWPGGYFITLQVHDELDIDMPSGRGYAPAPWRYNLPIAHEIRRLMMMGGDDINVPTPVGCTYHGKNWKDGKAIKV